MDNRQLAEAIYQAVRDFEFDYITPQYVELIIEDILAILDKERSERIT